MKPHFSNTDSPIDFPKPETKMNSLIKQLAEQATTRIEPTPNSGEGWIFDKEKFAELIVRECAHINYESPFQDGEFHAREVLEHFGVEK